MKAIFFLIVFAYQITYSQVGIGTTNPTEQLEVIGDVLLTSTIETSTITSIGTTDENFKMLARVTNSSPVGLIKQLDTDNINVTPIRRQQYKFTNLSNDNIIAVNLNLAVSDYVIIPTDFKWSGPGLEKAGVNNWDFNSFTIKITQNGGTPNNWQLELQNPLNEPVNANPIEYEVTLIIYQKAYFKEMGKVVEDISPYFNGVAVNTPAIFK